MQSLLKERFKLILHNETRELTTYLLVVDKTPKFHVVDASGGFSSNPFNMTDRGRITGTKVTAEMLAKVLSGQVKRADLKRDSGVRNTPGAAAIFRPPRPYRS